MWPVDVLDGDDSPTVLAGITDIMHALEVSNNLAWVQEVITAELAHVGRPPTVVHQVNLHLPSLVEPLGTIETLKLSINVVEL